MSKPLRPLTIRLSELRPVAEAVELTKGLRGRIVGGKKRSARLIPAEGGMLVELFGSSTFVPIATGVLDREFRVDPELFSGFIRNSIRAFHTAEIVSLDVDSGNLIARCGTLRVTLQLGAAPSSQKRVSPSPADRTETDLRPLEVEGERSPVEKVERNSEASKSRSPDDESNRNSTAMVGPTETDLRLGEAERELYRIEEIERYLQSAKRKRPDYEGLRFLAVGWFLLIALAELVFGGDYLPWLVVICSIAFFAEAWTDFAAEHEWEKERWKKKDEIPKILKRIELLGFSARQEPSRWVLMAKPKSDTPGA